MIAKPCETPFVMNCQICRRSAPDPAPIPATPAAVTPAISAPVPVTLPCPFDPIVMLASADAEARSAVGNAQRAVSELEKSLEDAMKQLAAAKINATDAHNKLIKAVTNGQ